MCSVLSSWLCWSAGICASAAVLSEPGFGVFGVLSWAVSSSVLGCEMVVHHRRTITAAGVFCSKLVAMLECWNMCERSCSFRIRIWRFGGFTLGGEPVGRGGGRGLYTTGEPSVTLACSVFSSWWCWSAGIFASAAVLSEPRHLLF